MVDAEFLGNRDTRKRCAIRLLTVVRGGDARPGTEHGSPAKRAVRPLLSVPIRQFSAQVGLDEDDPICQLAVERGECISCTLMTDLALLAGRRLCVYTWPAKCSYVYVAAGTGTWCWHGVCGCWYWYLELGIFGIGCGLVAGTWRWLLAGTCLV